MLRESFYRLEDKPDSICVYTNLLNLNCNERAIALQPMENRRKIQLSH
ncbi:hypothetical protein NIES22_21990 [Calothrix brevissima NIES-22]|nr:hypothetical protein NIES22_21990 [Calothrix brevissima NIES-22]